MGVNDADGTIPEVYQYRDEYGGQIVTAKRWEVRRVQEQTWEWLLGGELEDTYPCLPHYTKR